MALDIVHEDQYVQLTTLDTLLTNNTLDELERSMSSLMDDGHRNFIIDLGKLTGVGNDLSTDFSALQLMVEKEDGLLVCAGGDAEALAIAEESEIVTTPTLSEAVDYIFMEQIQRDLMDGDEEEEEDRDEE